ncbi:glycosyltransferase [Clostridium algoriphilum]|uniref:glycosyltransferase n=1 Tax=Clostridium algoriphilum TaxID=198347 RepID=UPI001CF16968|nr:glycosyltransferase [Clostridium algoriphilum]MCB2295342.1 glycosyltransferase [Clostridium algoriphilum]
MSILVSINCITYNHEEYIADAIESFLMQKTDFNFKIVIGEDCSLDGTRKIIDDYIIKYPNKIKLITSDENVGAKENSRRVHENSNGKYIALCEGDDYWTDPLKLQKQVTYMENNPNCTLCFHSADIVRANKRKTGRITRPYDKCTICPTEDIIIGGGSFCPTQSLLYPKKLMDNPPEFLTSVSVGDYPLQMLVSSFGYAYYIDEIMSSYRSGVKGSWTETSKTREKTLKHCEEIILMLDGFDKYSNYKFTNSVNKTKLQVKLYAKNYPSNAYIKLLNIKERIRGFIYSI